MSAPTFQCCPNCQRNVAERALVCRACYTVLPRKEKKEELVPNTTPRRLLWGQAGIVASVAIGIILWTVTAGFRLTPAEEAAEVNSGFSNALQFLEPGENRPRQSAGGTLEVAGPNASHPSVLKHENNCAVHQGVRNVGQKAATSAAFQLQFLNANGKPTGSPAEVEKLVEIPPGEERQIELSAPCPQEAVGAQVSLTLPSTSESKLELLTNSSTVYQQISSEHRFTIVVEIGPLEICVLPEGCQLNVSFEGNRKAQYLFRRDDSEPTILLSTNQILAGHLRQQRPATLELGDLKRTIIPLTYQHVHERKQEPVGVMARLRGVLSWSSGY